MIRPEEAGMATTIVSGRLPIDTPQGEPVDWSEVAHPPHRRVNRVSCDPSAADAETSGLNRLLRIPPGGWIRWTDRPALVTCRQAIG